MFVLESIKEYAESDKVAVLYREQSMSYRELDARSEAFAAWLLEELGDDRTPVVIYGHKEMEFLPCMYGALKAGRAYVPVDITVPPERAGQILEDVAPKVFIDLFGLEGVKPGSFTRIDRDMLENIFEKYQNTPVSRETWVKPEDDCYILFTSGSTGRPKGVPISRKNIENLERQLTPWCEARGDIILNQISYSFDVSVVSIYIGIRLGKTLFSVDKGMVENMKELFEALGSSGLAFWVSTPSFAEMCAVSSVFAAELLPNIETFLFCGETLTHKLADELAARFPGARVINTYGPTEATVLVTAVEITEEMRKSELSIPIGAPLEEVEFRIVDDKNRLIGSGGTGELLIVSDNVGRGYYNREDLTAKSFFETESRGNPKRGYRTGDACFEKNGLYYYCGRMDFQIKINGFRVELEDIENNLGRVENVIRAIVIPVTEGEKVSHLAAFALLKNKPKGSNLKEQLRIKEELGRLVPAYMVPRRIVFVESFPVNVNGKADRKALAALL